MKVYSTSTAVTVMMHDSNGVWYYGGQEWYERKTGTLPGISVSLVHVAHDAMVVEALSDLEKETNKHHACIIPGLNANGGISLLADRLMDMFTFTVENVNDISWQTIGRFFRTHASLYEKNVLSLPLSGDFVLLHYRQDVFREYGLTVPRTLEEYTLASQLLNGTDLNGDGELDYGSCLSHANPTSSVYYLCAWIAQTLHYRGTSQGSLLDPDTLTPLLENPVVQEALRHWKQVAGSPEMTRGLFDDELVRMYLSGRCAMTLGSSFYCTALQSHCA